MKADAIRKTVESSEKRLPKEQAEALKQAVHGRRPPDLVPAERMMLREARLIQAEGRPSPVALERIMGTNDLVDINYLQKAGSAARAVCRVILRDWVGREIGYATGFLVTSRLLLTNHHVLETAAAAETAHAEFDYELDAAGLPRPTTRFILDPGTFFLNDPDLDFALVAVGPRPVGGSGSLPGYGFLPLLRAEGKVNPGEFVTIIQHPSGQPKQIALRENELLSIAPLMLWYESDTAQGSSGSPVFNDSWQVVALHHSGVPRTNDQGQWLLKNGKVAAPDAEEGEIDWIANEGIRSSQIVKFVETNGERGTLLDEFLRGAAGQPSPEPVIAAGPESQRAAPGPERPERVPAGPAGTSVTVPVTFTITVEGTAALVPPSVGIGSVTATERMKVPVVDPEYGHRLGFDTKFLGPQVRLPDVDQSRPAKLDDGSTVLPYTHFSVIMDKTRRLALVTASNVDARPGKKEPEPGRDYSRKALGGLGPNDTEQWLTDPRIPEAYQLPDRFYTRDRGAFDKGHLVRREDVCWGDTYQEVRLANGDTYHTTNCSPQVADFNQAGRGGVWGKLENEILKQAKAEQYCIFAGPWLQPSDREFVGLDQRGEVRIRIPSKYWKVVVARAGDELRAFAFVLGQDLTGVPLEFAVRAEWVGSMVSVRDLEEGLGYLTFPDEIRKADQYGTVVGDELLRVGTLRGLEKGPSIAVKNLSRR